MKILSKFSLLCGLLAVLSLATATPSRAEDLGQIGRDIAAKWQNCVVTVEVLSKTSMSFMGQDNSEENKDVVNGSVIDPSGLMVTALSSLDGLDEDMFSYMMESMGEEAKKMTLKTEIKSVKMILSDGKEIPAELVLRDKDLDLAFIRPIKKTEVPMPALDLTQTGNPQMLDQVLTIDRENEVAGRCVSMTIDNINAVVTKPRKYYIAYTPSGCPAFTTDGKLVGIGAMRKLPKGAKSSSPYGNSISILVTADTIAEVAKQAVEPEAATK